MGALSTLRHARLVAATGEAPDMPGALVQHLDLQALATAE